MSGWALSTEAQEDLTEAFVYGLLEFGEKQARKYQAELQRTFDTIARFPQMARLRAEFDPPVRVHHHGRHYIAYLPRKDDVFIIRVVRDEADLSALFGPF